MGVDREPKANVALLFAVHAEIASLPDVIGLQAERQELTESVRKMYGSLRKAPKSDPLVQRRTDAERKHRAREEFYKKQRQGELRRNFFIEKDDALIEAQLSKEWAVHTNHTTWKTRPILVPERAKLARLVESEGPLPLSRRVEAV